MFDNDSEGEQVEEETDTDYKWRKERFEREQFIQEQQVISVLQVGSVL